MDVGVQMVFTSHGWAGISDSQVYDEEIRLALLADELGFDVVWSVEHHFFDYSFCPDNTQLLSHLSARLKRAEVGTAAVILPWNEPLRVAEKIALLDYLAEGKLRFGIGRGLSRREFASFRGIGMDESRERFDEAAALILQALRDGFMEGGGKYYPQPRAAIRPAPARDFADRLYAVASSDDSVESAARIRARMVMFADRSWEHRMPSVEKHRLRYREIHAEDAPPPMTCDFCYCSPDAATAEEEASRYLGTYLDSILEHYEIMGSHFASTKGYAAYAEASKSLNKMGKDGFLKGFMKATSWGTPDRILRTLEARRDLLGRYELATSFRFGGVPYRDAERSLRLFAKEVLPVVKSWN